MKNKIEMNRNAITLEEGFEQWIMNCKRRGFTEGTIKYYHYMSDIFMNVIPYKTELSSINRDVIDKFITALQDKEIKTTTINSYLNGIRAICNFWASKEYIKQITIKKIRCDEVIKETFNENEIKIILKKPNLKNSMLNKYYKSRGVSKTGVHIWRRTFAIDYIINGGNALKLQAQLCPKTLDI